MAGENSANIPSLYSSKRIAFLTNTSDVLQFLHDCPRTLRAVELWLQLRPQQLGFAEQVLLRERMGMLDRYCGACEVHRRQVPLSSATLDGHLSYPAAVRSALDAVGHLVSTVVSNYLLTAETA